MSSSDLVLTILNVLAYAPLLALVYAAYWAFDIRHALTVRLFRNQAFGLGLFSLVFTLAALPSPQVGSNGILGSVPFQIGYILVTSAFWLGAIYFVDATALASRRSDPLLRDTLHWSKVRYVLWVFQVFNVSFILLGISLSAITGNASYANQIIQGNNGAFTSLPAVIANLAWAAAFGSMIMFLPIAIRSRNPGLRRHLKWLAGVPVALGVFVIVLIIVSSTPAETFLNNPAGNVLGNTLLYLAVGYCLYRSARALVPLNRISLSSSDQVPGNLA
ncbi:MAG: hypothetical protein OK452_08835 [Thaumarchaeota archaeon]|nr:hypothetical protein [Nitrososphaerota archaeon]